jgi:hypothetical protein
MALTKGILGARRHCNNDNKTRREIGLLFVNHDMTLSIMTLSIMTLSIMNLMVTNGINNSEHKNLDYDKVK